MTEPVPTPLHRLWRQLAAGTAVGVGTGLVLGAWFAAAGFPDWAVTTWSFVTVVAIAVLPLALALRGVMHGVWRYVEFRIPRDRRTPAPQFWLTSYWPAYVVGAAAIAAHLVLTAVFVLGTGRTSPF